MTNSTIDLEERDLPSAAWGSGSGESPVDAASRVGMWTSPAVIAPNNFVFKSLSNWALNFAVGCSHACRFCYVPSAATIKQAPQLARFGIADPDAAWGDYVLLRPWDERRFLASLRAAERTPPERLKPDGNRAVMLCSTTDPYQVIHHPDATKRRELAEHARFLSARLHLWPDKSLGTAGSLRHHAKPDRQLEWLRRWWNRISEWPGIPRVPARSGSSRPDGPQPPAILGAGHN